MWQGYRRKIGKSAPKSSSVEMTNFVGSASSLQRNAVYNSTTEPNYANGIAIDTAATATLYDDYDLCESFQPSKRQDRQNHYDVPPNTGIETNIESTSRDEELESDEEEECDFASSVLDPRDDITTKRDRITRRRRFARFNEKFGKDGNRRCCIYGVPLTLLTLALLTGLSIGVYYAIEKDVDANEITTNVSIAFEPISPTFARPIDENCQRVWQSMTINGTDNESVRCIDGVNVKTYDPVLCQIRTERVGPLQQSNGYSLSDETEDVTTRIMLDAYENKLRQQQTGESSRLEKEIGRAKRHEAAALENTQRFQRFVDFQKVQSQIVKMDEDRENLICSLETLELKLTRLRRLQIKWGVYLADLNEFFLFINDSLGVTGSMLHTLKAIERDYHLEN